MAKLAVVFVLSTILGIGFYGYSSRQGKVKTQITPEKRRERSRWVYKGLNNPHSKKISETAASVNGDVKIEREIGLPILSPGLDAFNLETFLAKRACDADAIVIGKLIRGTSHVTEDESFIFTAQEFQVETILKDNPLQPLNTGEPITLFRTGGTVELNGKRIIAEDKAARGLNAGARYLLFLSYLPEKTVYAADNIGYEIRDEKIFKLTDQQLEQPLESGNDATLFTNSVKAAAAVSCLTTGGGK